MDDQANGHVMNGPGRDRKGMEDLVKAEPSLRGIRPSHRVDDCTQGVEDASNANQDRGRQAGRVDQLWYHEDRHPAQEDIETRLHPARSIDPQDAEEDASDRAGPNDR